MKIFIIALAFLAINNSDKLFGQSPLPAHSSSVAVLITLSNGDTGSGFFIASSNHLFLATAGHVLFDKSSGKLLYNQANVSWHYDDGTNHYYSEIQMNLGVLHTNNEIRLHPTHDVSVVRIGAILADGQDVFNFGEIRIISTNAWPVVVKSSDVRKLKDVNVGDDVYVFGYPGSVGLKQSPKFDYSKPLMRKGIVSGIYDQAQTIVIDAAVYFGNSGGPVVEKQEINFGQTSFTIIGVASEIIPFVDVWENKRYEYSNINVSNSGYAVVEPVDFILELLWDN